MRVAAEWELQSAVQLIWPDETTPWDELDAVQECYCKIIYNVTRFEKVLLVCTDIAFCRKKMQEIASQLNLKIDFGKIKFFTSDINDTWARDNGAISVQGEKGEKYIYDFVFNAWGQKFPSNFDNQITKIIYKNGAFAKEVIYRDLRPFVLEGGSVDFDGKGTMITTAECLLSLNRNEYLSKEEIEEKLKAIFGLKRIIWLNNGAIAGDDTDSHVDILARFCDEKTIAYCSVEDENDENYESLKKMEQELRELRTLDGEAYNLIALPLPKALYLDDYRLPASYANFLIINGAVLVPASMDEMDELVKERLEKAFPNREIIMIDCRPLLSGHGGLHCITMQFPERYIA